MASSKSYVRIAGSLLVLTVLLILPTTLEAQRFNFRQYQPDEGLDIPELAYLEQDSRGNLWIGTRGQGLYKFDGRDFQKHDRGDSLAGDFVVSLLIDKSEDIWVGTLSGLSRYNGRAFVSKGLAEGIPGVRMRAIYEDGHGKIWFSTDSVGIGVYEKGKVLLYSQIGSMTDAFVTAISGNKNGQLYFGTQKGEIITFSETDTSIVEIPNAGEINCIIENGDELWIGSEEGLFLMQDGVVLDLGERFTQLYKNTIYDINPDKYGNLWFGTARGAFELTGNVLVPYGEKEGLVDSEVYAILQDKDENMWFAAGKEGLFSFMGDRFTYLTLEDGLAYKYISGIEKDNKGVYWIASFGGGVMRYVNKSVQSVQLNPSLDNALITVTFKDSKGDLWFGTRNSGIYRYSLGSKGARKISSTLNVNSIIENRKGELLIGHELGIDYYNFKRGRIVNKRKLPYPAKSLFEDEVARLWVGTDRGLVLPDLDSTINLGSEVQITSITQDMYGAIWASSLGKGLFRFEGNHKTVFTEKQGLSSNLQYFIQFDQNGFAWLSNTEGMDRIVVDELGFIEEVKSYGLDEGYVGIGRYESGFLSERNGNIWFGTNERIMIYNSLADDVSEVRPEIHLTGLQLFREEVDWKLLSDTVESWTNTPQNLELDYDQNHLTFNFAGVNLRSAYDIRYVYKLDPLEPNWSPPTENKSAVYPNLPSGEYVFSARAFSEGNEALFHEISYGFTVKKPFWQYPLFYLLSVIAFFLLAYYWLRWYVGKVSRENRQLEGKIKKRTAEIYSQKEELQERKEELETINDQLSHAHDTINTQNVRLKSYNDDLEVQVKERTKKLAKTNQELISINNELDTFIYKASHDLLGPLARLKGICNVAGLEVKEETAQKYFGMLNESAEQTYDILQTLIKIISIKEATVKKGLIDFEKMVLEVLAEIKAVSGYDEVDISYTINGIESVNVDKELMKIVLHNIIQNAIEYRDFTKKRPYVNMVVSNGDGTLKIQIKDNGVGIDEGVSQKIFDMFYRGTVLSKGSGLGLYIAQVIVKKLDGSVRYSINQKNETVFSIHVPQ